MRIKLDENLGQRGAEVLRAAGHDVETVVDERIVGVSDDELYEICRAEGRSLVTLDHDFGSIVRDPPGQPPGVVVLELRGSATPSALAEVLDDLVLALGEHDRHPFWVF